MARTQKEDPLQGFRFVVIDQGEGSASALDIQNDAKGRAGAGFVSCSIPEMTVVTEEVKEGNWEFPRKVVMSATVNQVTLTRGVILNRTDFWNWIVAAMIGAVPRRWVQIQMMNRQGRFPLKAWNLYEVIPVRYKPASDLVATDGEVSIAELDLDYNYFEEVRLTDIPDVV